MKRSRKPQVILTPGTILGERYIIEDVIGRGGMGAVYAARDKRFRAVVRRCAVKEMYDQLLDEEARRRAVQSFEREANILASLNHPAIPKVYDYFTEGDHHYLILEYIPGQNLLQYMQKRGRPITAEQAIDWGLQLTDVLSYLHNYNPPIIFRDLKPSNIMLRPDGSLALVDFGIAKHFQHDTRNTMIGTEGYAPPEQYEGIATPLVDIYALGATLHHLLTNTDPQQHRPFSFDTRPIREYNPTVSEDLEDVIMRAVAEDPLDRWQSAEEMHQALKSLSRGTMHSARTLKDSSTRRITRQITRRLLDATKEVSPTQDVAPTRPVSDEGPATVPIQAHTRSFSVEPRWIFRTEEEVRSTPCLHEGYIYIGSYDNNLYCLDAETGEFLWKFPTRGGIPGRAAVYQNMVIVGSEDKCVYAIDALSGRQAWKAETQGRVRASPCVAYDNIYIGSDDGMFYCLDAASGRILWKYEVGAPIRSTATVYDQIVIFGAEDTQIHGVDVMTGASRWKVRTNGPVISSPALAGDRIVIGSMDWVVYSIDASSGWVIWRYRTGDRVVSSPFVDGSKVYIGSVDSHVYCIDGEWGKLVWKRRLGHQVTSSPWVHEGRLYVGCVDGNFYCLETTHGRIQWSFQTGGPIPGSPRIGYGNVYFGSLDHFVYALPLNPDQAE
nr:serine/threonine-protein kinase [Ardenticatena sp.]